MASYPSIIGFPLHASYKFLINGVSYKLGRIGKQTVLLAVDALYLLKMGNSPVVLRQLVRSLKHSGSPAALAHLIEMTPDRDLRLVAVWLRGLCGGTIGSKALAKLFTGADEQLRYVLAKAMQRMKAWHDLGRLAKNDSSSRIQRIASHTPAIEFRTRLESYVAGVEEVKHQASPYQPLFLARIDFTETVLPKDAFAIREILERIRGLVHGQ